MLKKIIRGTLAGTPPANAPTLARQAFLASRTNFFLSVPLLFYMAASSLVMTAVTRKSSSATHSAGSNCFTSY